MRARMGRLTMGMTRRNAKAEGVGGMAGRKAQEVVRVHDEIARVQREIREREPSIAVARPVAPLPARTRDGRNVLVIREEHHHHHAPPAELGVRWKMLAAYAFGILMLLVVLGLLIASGAIDLHALQPPWQETGR